jgi:hypothetical protein
MTRLDQTRVCTTCGKVLWAGQSCDHSRRTPETEQPATVSTP